MGFAQALGRAALGPLSRTLPALGTAERAALEAGTVGFEGQLLAGNPDFDALSAVGPNRLTTAESDFLGREVVQLCALLDDFAIEQARDLPPAVWQFLREKKFFGMSIPPEFGGLGLSRYAQATVVARIATVNIAAAITVLTPNAAGPAALLLRFGTDVQKRYYLPRLARGQDLPCFAPAHLRAGMDMDANSAAPQTRGLLCERDFNGRRTRGFLVSFDQRCVMLAPMATVMGLAFHAVDDTQPDGRRDLGMTCALVPVPHAGVQIGNRHFPMGSSLMNGPIRAHETFVPIDWVIGGETQVGRGWPMLAECLAAGRALAAPALGSALQQLALFVGQGYGRVCEQFGLPFCRLPAVAAALAQMSVELYATDAARRYLLAVLDAGERPGVAVTLLQPQLAEAGRRAINRGMDLLGGKAIVHGPSNLLATAYRHAPMMNAADEAQLCARSRIGFDQGALRCHPYAREKAEAVAAHDPARLGRALLGHLAHQLRTAARCLFGAPIRGRAPVDLAREARLIAKLAVRFALSADLASGAARAPAPPGRQLGQHELRHCELGQPALKQPELAPPELTPQRLGEAWSHLYLASACVWRYEADNDVGMLPIARAAIREQLSLATGALRDVCANLPLGWRRGLGWLLLRGAWHLAPLRDGQRLALAALMRKDPRPLARLAPDIGAPKCGGLLDLIRVQQLAEALGADELAKLQAAWQQTPSIELAASASTHSAAIAYLRAADHLLEVDDFAPARTEAEGPRTMTIRMVVGAESQPAISA